MCPATESGRTESRPFVIDDYFLRLFLLEEHQWRIVPHRNASVPQPQRMVVKFYSYTNTMRTANETKNTSLCSIKAWL